MMQTLIALSAIYISSSSGSRLLLQQYVPVQTPGAIPPEGTPATPPQGTPAAVPPAAVPPATEPPVTEPPVVVPPVIQTTQATPLKPYQTTQAGAPPYYNNYYQPAPLKLECKVVPVWNAQYNGVLNGPNMVTDPSFATCAMQTKNVNNPNQNFEFLCDSFEACVGTTVNINFDQNAPYYLESLKGFWFTDQYSGANAVINIVNNRPGDKIIIDEIKCQKVGSCLNTQFIIGPNMELQQGDFFCSPGACNGCVVKETANDPGVPCHAFVEPI